MGQPTPPGDIPLIDGLGPEWNDIVGAIPEDKRAELAPKFKERLSDYEPLKQWEDLHKSGITPDQAGTALNVLSMIENDPHKIYKAIGDHLGLTKEEVKEVVEEIKEGDSNDPRFKRMEEQLETLARIALTERQMTAKEKQVAEEEAALDQELSGLRKKYGNDFSDDEIVMRMLYKDMTAEQAYQDYSSRVTELRSKRPSPMVIGSGGGVPARQLDVTKLDSKGTKSLVTQMLDHANAERNQ